MARRTKRLTEAEIAARLRLSATRLARRLRQESASGLSPSQFSALAVIHNRGPITLGELAELERVAPPTITKVVAKLEEDGFVERRADPTDKRVSLVQVTTAGGLLHDETKRRRTTWLTGRLRELSPEDQARLADALDALDRLHGDEP